MNKQDLITAVADKTGLTKAASGEAVSAVLEAITVSLSKGDGVAFVGFGTFAVKHRPARTGRNPSTGKEIKIPAKKAVTFKAGKGMLDTVNA